MAAQGRSGGFALMLALASLGCQRQQEVALYPTSSEHALDTATAERISTAEEEADYWSSTYGNPRPKLTETMTLGTSDLPTSAPSPLASLSPDTALPASSPFAQASATAIVVVPGAAQWSTGRFYTTPSVYSRRHHSSRSAKHTHSKAPPKVPAPAPPSRIADAPTRRTSIVAPTTAHVARE